MAGNRISINLADVQSTEAGITSLRTAMEENGQRHVKAYGAISSDGSGSTVMSGEQYAALYRTGVTKVIETIQAATTVARTAATEGTNIDIQFGKMMAG